MGICAIFQYIGIIIYFKNKGATIPLPAVGGGGEGGGIVGCI